VTGVLAVIAAFAALGVFAVAVVILWAGASLLVYAAINGVVTVMHRIRSRRDERSSPPEGAS
jgi:Flp pilus assembly protein TadB